MPIMPICLCITVSDLLIGKQAYQSSTEFNADPEKAVDGDFNANFMNIGGSCSHTQVIR